MRTIDKYVNKKFGPLGYVSFSFSGRSENLGFDAVSRDESGLPETGPEVADWSVLKLVTTKANRAKRLAPEERRIQLLDAAIETFCRHGVDGTTMHQLAEAAGVSYGLFYHYFSSKEQVLMEAVDQLPEVEVIEAFLSKHEAPLSEHLITFSKVYQESMEPRKECYWLLFSESRKRPSLAARLSQRAERFRRALIGYLEARQKKGEISLDTDLDVVTRVVFSYLFMRLLWIEDEPPVEDHMAIIIHGILRRDSY